MNFNFIVSGDEIRFCQTKHVAYTGNVNTYKCKFSFTEEWAELNKFLACLVNGKCYITAIQGNECLLPSEALFQADYITLGVYGTNGSEDDFRRISTGLETIYVGDGAYKENSTSPLPPTPDIWEALINKNIPYIGDNGNWYIYSLEEKKYVDSGAASRGDQGKQGEKGDQGKQGEKGDQGNTPVRGVDYWTEADKAEVTAEVKKGIEQELAEKANKSSTYHYSILENKSIAGITVPGIYEIGAGCTGLPENVNSDSTIYVAAMVDNDLGTNTDLYLIDGTNSVIYYARAMNDLEAFSKSWAVFYSKSEQEQALAEKSDKATTLAGYGITDAYTKDETDGLLLNKADFETDEGFVVRTATEFTVNGATDNLEGWLLVASDADNRSADNAAEIEGLQTAVSNKADKDDLAALIPKGEASGETIVLTDHLENAPLIDYKAYGNSVQEGTPSPEYPSEIKSVGELVTEGEHYGKYKIPIEVRGKNLLNPAGIEKAGTGTKYGEFELIGDTAIFTTAEESYGLSLFRGNLKLNTQYTISMNASFTGTCSGNYGLRVKVGQNGEWGPVQYDNLTYTFTTDETAPYIAITYYVGFPYTKVGDVLTVTNIQLEEGAAATEYEPYSGGTYTVYANEPLRKVGDYADYVDFENQQIARKVGQYKFTGEERVNAYSVGGVYNGFAVPCLPNTLTRADGLCNYYRISKVAQEQQDSIWIGVNNNIIYFINNSFYDGEAEDKGVKEFKTWLVSCYTNGNPVTIYYPLAEPVNEPIEVPAITVPKSSIAYISEGTSVKGSMEVQYYQDVNKKLDELQAVITALGGV